VDSLEGNHRRSDHHRASVQRRPDAAARTAGVRFEDKNGSEQLFIHAEPDQDIEVESDETYWVGHDRTKTTDHDEMTHVKQAGPRRWTTTRPSRCT
jgi:uncharacterized protein involved in type VI secretion and phage assembly